MSKRTQILNLLNLSWCYMKQGRNILLWIALFSASSFLCLSAIAQTYHNDFDGFKEKNWDLWGIFSIWNAEKGYLRGRIQVPPVPHTRTEMLQFKGLPGTYLNFNIDTFIDPDIIQRQIKRPGYENFTITLKDLGARAGDFGIALGQLLHPPDASLLFYLFFTDSIRAVNVNGGSFPDWHVPRHPATRWETRELGSMELRFNNGHFQCFANGEKRADFKDPEFSAIEIIGFVLEGHDLHVGSGWVDSFTMSVSGLAVSSQAKLATTWGQLKQHQ